MTKLQWSSGPPKPERSVNKININIKQKAKINQSGGTCPLLNKGRECYLITGDNCVNFSQNTTLLGRHKPMDIQHVIVFHVVPCFIVCLWNFWTNKQINVFTFDLRWAKYCAFLLTNAPLLGEYHAVSKLLNPCFVLLSNGAHCTPKDGSKIIQK